MMLSAYVELKFRKNNVLTVASARFQDLLPDDAARVVHGGGRVELYGLDNFPALQRDFER